MPARMTSTRTLVLAAAVVTLLVGLQARLLPYLPGDIAVASGHSRPLSPGHRLGGADAAPPPARRSSSS